jgi:ABC-2 type transport system ATP-binding protein
MNSSIAISVQNLQYSDKHRSRSRTILRDLSFTLPIGQCLAFTGKNGTGKTTTLQLLAGLLEPEQGKILIQGIDLQKNPLAAKPFIGFLADQLPHYPELTVNEYLMHIANLRKIPGNMAPKTIAHWCAALNLQKHQNQLMGILSKGQKQRVGMAQALLHHPTVLLLDEPTQGLDSEQIASFIELILGYKTQAAIILSTHNPMEIDRLSDHQLIFKHEVIKSDDHHHCPA